MFRGLTDVQSCENYYSEIKQVFDYQRFMGCASLRSDVIPPFKSGGSTLEFGYPTLESCYPTSDGPSTSASVLPTAEGVPAAESGSFYRCIRATPPLRVLLPPNPNCQTGIRVVPHRNRAVPPLNPARNPKSQGEFTASRQI